MYLTRQPVLNKQRAITANRLAVHSLGAPLAQVADELNALAEVWPGERTVFLALTDQMPDDEFAAWIPGENTLLELSAGALSNPPTIDWLSGLAQIGLCLDGVAAPGATLPPNASLRFTLLDAAQSPGALKVPGLTLAHGLADAEHFARAVDGGFAGACGWFFLNTKPSSKALVPAHAQIVRLLNLVRQDAEVKDIETVLKQDVALSFKLLRYINSAGFGLQCEIQNFRHAVTILGYQKLHKWLSLLLVTASKDPAAPALMQASVARGRFMELVGKGYFDRGEQDNLFIAGAFSLLGVLLGTSLDSVLEQMHLPQSISDALLGVGGVYEPFLALAKACEASDGADLARRADALQLNAETVNRAHLQAVSFADSLQLN